MTTDLDVSPHTKRREAKEPARRWVNVWRITRISIDECSVCGRERLFYGGEVARSCCATWPSEATAREVAETIINDGRATFASYLGPEPIEEAP